MHLSDTDCDRSLVWLLSLAVEGYGHWYVQRE